MKLGELAVYLTANTADFTSKLKGAENQLSRMAGKFAAFGAAGFSVGAAFEFARRSTNEYLADVKELNRISKMSGMDIGQVDALADAGKAAGVGIDSISTAVRMMQKQIGQTEAPLAYRAALAEIGVTIDELKGRNPAEQFKTIAGALAEVTDPTTRNALAMELFGKRGNEIIPMLKDGKAGLEEFMGAAEKWGFAMSDASIKSAMEVNKGLKEIGYEWDALKVKLTENIFLPIQSNMLAAQKGATEKAKDGASGRYANRFANALANYTPLGILENAVGTGEKIRMDYTEADKKKLADYKNLAESGQGVAYQKEQQAKTIADAKAQIEAEKNANKVAADKKRHEQDAEKASKWLAEHEAKKAKELKDSEMSLFNARERAYMDSISAEEKLAYLTEKRQAIFDSINTSDELNTNKKQEQLVEISSEMEKLKQEGAASDRFSKHGMVGAMERGSVDAYSAIAKAGGQEQQLIVKNTREVADKAGEQVALLKTLTDSLTEVVKI